MISAQRPSNLIFLIAVLVVVRRAESSTTETPTTITESISTVSPTSEMTSAMPPTSTSDATMASTEKETTTDATDGTTPSTINQSTTTTTTIDDSKNETGVTLENTTGPISTHTTQSQETTELSTITTTEETETTSSDPTTSSPHSTSEMSTDETTLDSTASSFETTQPSNEITTTSNNTTTTSAPDTTTGQPSTTTEDLVTTEIIEQTITSTESVDSTTEMTSTPESTTQPDEAIYPSIENAVLDFTFILQFKGCSYNKTSIDKELAVVSSTVYGCEYIRVRSIKSCASGRSKRSTTESYTSVDTVFGIDAEIGVVNGSDVSTELYTALSNIPGIDETYLNNSRNNFSNALTSQSICDADSCKSALIGRPGYICVKEDINNMQRCAIRYYCKSHPIDCGGNGECYVETEIRSGQTSYISKCRCKTEEYYRYEGTNCTDKVITWQLAVIICISGAAALVLILLFVIISLCCRNSSNSADVSFDESELIYSPSGITSVNQYKNGRSRDSSKGIQNGAYMEVGETSAGGSWRPEDSANTYANIDSKLRESNYQIQIKRPQYRKSDEITEF